MEVSNKEIIEALKRLDLSLYPYDEVKRLISQFQPKILRITIPEGSVIERIRPDIDVFERKDVSYRPADKNVNPQRATLPRKTAFYGIISHIKDPLYKNRYIALLEASKIYKQGPTCNGVEHYTLSRWVTNAPIGLAVFAHQSVFQGVRDNALLDTSKKELNERASFIDDIFQFDEYMRFVSEQFAEPVDPTENYKYIISATIAEMLMYASNLDGVMYPSVQAVGEHGMNVALRPDIADNKLVLVDVNELEYTQKDGEGHLRFTKSSIPDLEDIHGYKHWSYVNYKRNAVAD